jgi:AmpE protein
MEQSTDKNAFFSHPWLALGVIVLPIIFIVSMIYVLIHDVFFGLGGLLFSISIFFYCLGPQNAFYPLAYKKSNSPTDLVRNYFALINSQIFAVLFWFIVAGPIAALTYRLLSLCKNIDRVSKQATQIVELLEWLPARMAALLFLLVGNFQRGLSTFIHYFFAKPNLNTQMLTECGLQAVRADGSNEFSVPAAEILVEHATIVLLVFVALLTIAAWV